MNFGIYTHTPLGLEGDYLHKVTRGSQITPEQLDWFQREALDQMPQRFSDIARVPVQERTIEIHPILDRVPDSFVTMDGMGLLIGDAGAVLRPHTASGTTKAIMEALLLQKLAQSPDATWESVSEAYQADRNEDVKAKVALGTRLGLAQVLETPDWASMSQADYEAWLAAQVADSGSFVYKNVNKKKE